MREYHTFKSGIVVSFPDTISKSKIIEEWTTVKMAMSLILDPPTPVESEKLRKKYTLTKEGLRKRRKSWRSQKKKQ